MNYITYTLEPFSSSLAQRGRLCVVTKGDYAEDTISTDSAKFIQTCVCTVVSSEEFSVLIGDTNCTFDMWGFPKDAVSSDYRLYMASTTMDIQSYGNAIKRTKKVTTIKTEEGVRTEVKDYTPRRAADEDIEKNVLISSLNARDNFALQALKCIMPIIPDIKTIGDNERDYYCKLAYQWAANMMDNAAQVRATFDDQTHSTTQSTDITELESNTDKILNNILFSLEETVDSEKGSNRIVNPELNEKIDALIVAVGVQTEAINRQTTALNNIAEAINSLDINNRVGEER